MLDATLPRVQDVDLRRLFRMEYADMNNGQPSKYGAIFETVYTEINRRRSAQHGGNLDDRGGTIKAVLAENGIDQKSWYVALSRAKKMTPHTYALLYAALGEEPPPPRASRSSSDDDEVEEQPTEEVEETTPATSDCLANAVAWIERAPEDDRKRVILAVAAFFGVSLVRSPDQ